MEFVGVNDQFGESGKPSDLMKNMAYQKNSLLKAVKSFKKKIIYSLSK